MNTTEAFTIMISTKKIHEKLKIPEGTVKSLKSRLKHGEFISTDKMMELLIRAGYSVETEMTWADAAKSPSKKKST